MKVQTEVNDLTRLTTAAIKFLGCEVVLNAVPRYYGTDRGGNESQRCDLVIKLPGRYDLGALRQSDGTYTWVCDSELLSGGYGQRDKGRIILGEHASNLLMAYGQVSVETELIPGAAYHQEIEADGTVAYFVEESELERLGYSVNG